MLAVVSAAAALCALWFSAGKENLAMANPASVNCEKKGGKVEIRTDVDGEQYGVCVFANKSECYE